MGILIELVSEIRGFVDYIIIIYQNWTIYTYVALLLREIVSNILYKSLHFCEEIVYVINY